MHKTAKVGSKNSTLLIHPHLKQLQTFKHSQSGEISQIWSHCSLSLSCTLHLYLLHSHTQTFSHCNFFLYFSQFLPLVGKQEGTQQRIFYPKIAKKIKRSFYIFLRRYSRDKIVPFVQPFGPRGTNLNSSCRRSTLTQQNQSLPIPTATQYS